MRTWSEMLNSVVFLRDLWKSHKNPIFLRFELPFVSRVRFLFFIPMGNTEFLNFFHFFDFIRSCVQNYFFTPEIGIVKQLKNNEVWCASYYIGTRHNQPKSAALAYFETTTPMGAQTKVVLPDQSVVWVNAGSTLRYGSDFNTNGRSVQLDGEAYFEITRDSLKPFIVKSKKLDIKVLGTRFNVKAYGMDEMTDVTLVSGKVNVSLRDEVAHAGDVTLTPNRKLSFNKQTNKVRVSEVDAKDALSWMDGSLKFSEQPFMSIAKDLERKFNVRIRVESDLLRKEIFSGSFTKDYSLDKILREVDVDHKYVWTRSGDEIIIKDK